MRATDTLGKYFLMFSGAFLFVGGLRDSVLTGRYKVVLLGLLMFLAGRSTKVPTEEKVIYILTSFFLSVAFVSVLVYVLGYVA